MRSHASLQSSHEEAVMEMVEAITEREALQNIQDDTGVEH